MMFFHAQKPTLIFDVPKRFVVSELKRQSLEEFGYYDFAKRHLDGENTNGHPYLDGIKNMAWVAASTLENEEDRKAKYRERVDYAVKHDVVIVDSLRAEDWRDHVLPARLNGDGTFELVDGHHRAAVLILKGAETLRIGVVYISPEWKRLVATLRQLVGGKNHLYAPIDHPFFAGWKTYRNKGREADILNFLSEIKLKSRLHYDIGCNTGFLCREFERGGFTSIGIDISEDFIYVAERLNAVFKTNVAYYATDRFLDIIKDDWCNNTGVITALSVLHHWIRQEGNDERYTEAVRMMSDKSFVFFIDCADESQNFVTSKTTNIPLNREGYEAWLRDVIGCKSVRYIGTHDFNRPLFACSKRVDF